MSDPPNYLAKSREAIEALLATAERCRRLAASITDRQTVERLLEMARECEERAAAIRRGSDE
jgi:hypothetical protein